MYARSMCIQLHGFKIPLSQLSAVCVATSTDEQIIVYFCKFSFIETLVKIIEIYLPEE